jgi:hypothetical protein
MEYNSALKKNQVSQAKWLMSLILAAWEAEIGRMEASLSRKFTRPPRSVNRRTEIQAGPA